MRPIKATDPSQFRCCFCFHVRTGTVILGVFHLVLYSLVFSLLAVMCLKPGLLEKERGDPLAYIQGTENDSCEKLGLLRHRNMNREDRMLGLMITVGFFAVAVMLVYGAVRGRPGYVLPFFCVQVFDFCISCLTVLGYFSYVPNMKNMIADCKNQIFKEQLMQMDGDVLMLILVLFFVLVLTIKAYFIGVVWACYKYLHTYERSVVRGVITGYHHEVGPEDGQMLLPPKYEDAILEPLTEEPAPPPYTQN